MPAALAEKVKAVHRRFEEAGIPHAFGGALALAYYAEPRKTRDIDVNVFVPVEHWPEVRDALSPLGIDVEVDEDELKREGEAKLGWDANPVHLFFSHDSLHEEMPRKVRQVPYDEETIPLLSPEHLIVRKTILGRPKDQGDIEEILASTPVDRNEIDEWIRQFHNPSPY